MGDHPISPRWPVALSLRGDKDWNRLGHQRNDSTPFQVINQNPVAGSHWISQES